MRPALPLAVASTLCVAAAAATLVQPLGCAQTSHYALVRSLADGRATIDRYQADTCDKSYTNGHFYANKAPALAALLVPLHASLRAAGKVPGSERTAVWELGLLGALVPFLAIVALAWLAAERIEPGLGTAVAVTLGSATLLLPFASLLFSHLLAAALAFAAFVLLWGQRAQLLRPLRIGAAGLLAGLACTAEYPVGVVAVALAVYAALGHRSARRLAAYAVGGLLGLAPLLLYNQWAFGSPTHLSYRDVVLNAGNSGHDLISHDAGGGIFGIHAPSPRVALELLFAGRGLITLTPVVAAALVGLVLLYRAGRRPEAGLIAALVATFLVWNSGFYVPFGGDVPGPRYLMPLLPFLALPLACAYRRYPIETALLAGASLVGITVATATQPMLGHDDTRAWFREFRHGEFTNTVVTFVTGQAGWAEILPFFGLLLMGVVLAIVATRATVRRQGVPAAAWAAPLGAWAVVATVVPPLLRHDREHGGSVGVLVAALVVAAAVGLMILARSLAKREAAAMAASPQRPS